MYEGVIPLIGVCVCVYEGVILLIGVYVCVKV